MSARGGETLIVTNRRSPRVALAAVLVGGIALGGCGSAKTITVSVGSTETTAKASASGTAPVANETPASPKTRPGAQPPRVASPAPTRKAPAPAFTGQAGPAEGLAAALQTVRARGFHVGDSTSYHSNQTLRVLIGTRSGAEGDGHGQQAFFFEDGRFLGTDSSQPSATIKVLGQSDTEVILAYALYRPHDPLCCPSAGQARVRFQLDNGRLQALDAIPPASSDSVPSRQ